MAPKKPAAQIPTDAELANRLSQLPRTFKSTGELPYPEMSVMAKHEPIEVAADLLAPTPFMSTLSQFGYKPWTVHTPIDNARSVNGDTSREPRPQTTTEAAPLCAPTTSAAPIYRRIEDIRDFSSRGKVGHMMRTLPECSVQQCMDALILHKGSPTDAVEWLIQKREVLPATATLAPPGNLVKPEPRATPTQHHPTIVTAVQKSHFFRLPEHVRTRIYRLVLISATPIQIKRRPFPGEPNLLFTCKEIRKQAQLIFWTQNSFQGRDAVYICNSRNRPPQVLYQRKLSVLLEWLCRIGAEKARLITRLTVDYDEDCQFNGHPAYLSNWPATAEDVMKHKKPDLAAAARFSAIKVLRGLLFHGVGLDAVKPVPIVKGALRAGQGDQFGALWKLAMEEVIGILRTAQPEVEEAQQPVPTLIPRAPSNGVLARPLLTTQTFSVAPPSTACRRLPMIAGTGH